MQTGLRADSCFSQNYGTDLTPSPESGEVPCCCVGSTWVVCLWLCSVSESSFGWTSVMCHFLRDTHLHSFFVTTTFLLMFSPSSVNPLGAYPDSVQRFLLWFHLNFTPSMITFCFFAAFATLMASQSVRLWRMSHGSISARQGDSATHASLPLRGLVVDARWPIPDCFDRGDMIGHRSWWASVIYIVTCGLKQWCLCFMHITHSCSAMETEMWVMRRNWYYFTKLE